MWQNKDETLRSELFNAAMSRLAREARELTQAELAAASGVTRALISKIENGLIQPSDDVLDKICESLQFPPAFFRQSERTVGFPPFHKRKRARMGAKSLARIGAIINIQRQHIVKLSRSYDRLVLKPIPQVNLHETGLTPERAAQRLREYWMLPRGPVTSVTDLIEEAGGIVVLAKFGTALLDGLSFRSEGLPPLFFMNKDVPGERLRCSLAHELGHVVMHTIPTADEVMEEQASQFAAAFLMPRPDIVPYLTNAKLSTLGRVKPYWKVSIKALIKRAYELELITDYQYKCLNTEYNKAFKDAETNELERERPNRLLEMVRYHTEDLEYSHAELSELLLVTEEYIQDTYLGGRGLRLIVSNPSQARIGPRDAAG